VVTEAAVRLGSPAAERAAPRSVTILGATGSIGTSTLDVIARHPGRFRVVAVTAWRSAEQLARIARTAGAGLAVIADPASYRELAAALAGSGIEAAAGPEALVEAAARPADLVVGAIVGAAGLAPAMAAIGAGADIALANKECLVCAGDLFMRTAAEHRVKVLPVDSEHNAVFQLLEGRGIADIDRIVLTASGGPFRGWTRAAMAAASPADALKHPNWSMGPKISVDSATMMNKGLELIEAHHLFGVGPERLEVLVHPQSVVHAIVRYADGTMLAELGPADMRGPIARCLAWPQRPPAPPRRLDLAALGSLSFEAPDPERFPALLLARAALAAGGWATNILNAANEVAVEAFLAGRLGFLGIAGLVEDVLDRASGCGLSTAPATVEEALAIDALGRRLAAESPAAA
jgi:1-deoxy-D-xylulose-5-phosphate reductoisomerase